MEKIEADADRLQRTLKKFIRLHQFRDRNEMSPFGVTVSQCYTLDALGDKGGLTMRELAGEMYLTTATMTGIVEELVKKGLVERTSDKNDRRLIRVILTSDGLETYGLIKGALLNRYMEILRNHRLSAGDVDKVIKVFEELTAVSLECCKTDKLKVGKSHRPNESFLNRF